MMRFTGALCSGLGLLWFGPGFAQELAPKPAPENDPLTEAWFDTVQSIGVLEGLSRQLDVRRAGAVDNLRRNTESPLGDSNARQARLDELEREIARLRSEFELLARPAPAPERQVESGPRAPRIEAPTVGLSDAGRAAMLDAARSGAAGTPAAIQPELPPIDVPALPSTNNRFTQIDGPVATNAVPTGAMPSSSASTQSAPSNDASTPPVEPVQTAPTLSPAEQRIAELEAELAALTRAAQAPSQPPLAPTDPLNAAADSTPADPLAADGELPTTLVLGPLEARQPSASGPASGPSTGSSTAPVPTLPPASADGSILGGQLPGEPVPSGPVSGSPATTGQPSNGDVGTLPVADRIERARLEAEARAEAERQALAAAMTVEGYSADPVRQGRAAYFAGEYERAVSLLAREPDRMLAVYWQAKSLEKLDRMSEAMKGYERVAASEGETDLAERAQFDLEFLRWRWEHNEAFSQLKETLEAKRKP
ncbi:MAG: hypothetical protein AAFZ65_06280 [Planctomycetota bacterium]